MYILKLSTQLNTYYFLTSLFFIKYINIICLINPGIEFNLNILTLAQIRVMHVENEKKKTQKLRAKGRSYRPSD